MLVSAEPAEGEVTHQTVSVSIYIVVSKILTLSQFDFDAPICILPEFTGLYLPRDLACQSDISQTILVRFKDFTICV